MNYEFKTKMNNKLENLSCGFTFIVIILYQKSFIKNYGKFESEVCIVYVIRQKN